MSEPKAFPMVGERENVRLFWGRLETPLDCDEAIRRIGQERLRVNNAILGLERDGSVALSWEQSEKLTRLKAELQRLLEAKQNIKDLSAKLKEDANDRWSASFKLAAKEILDGETFMRIVARADEIEVVNSQRRNVGATGSAIGVRASVGGTKERK